MPIEWDAIISPSAFTVRNYLTNHDWHYSRQQNLKNPALMLLRLYKEHPDEKYIVKTDEGDEVVFVCKPADFSVGRRVYKAAKELRNRSKDRFIFFDVFCSTRSIRHEEALSSDDELIVSKLLNPCPCKFVRWRDSAGLMVAFKFRRAFGSVSNLVKGSMYCRHQLREKFKTEEWDLYARVLG